MLKLYLNCSGHANENKLPLLHRDFYVVVLVVTATRDCDNDFNTTTMYNEKHEILKRSIWPCQPRAGTLTVKCLTVFFFQSPLLFHIQIECLIMNWVNYLQAQATTYYYTMSTQQKYEQHLIYHIATTLTRSVRLTSLEIQARKHVAIRMRNLNAH